MGGKAPVLLAALYHGCESCRGRHVPRPGLVCWRKMLDLVPLDKDKGYIVGRYKYPWTNSGARRYAARLLERFLCRRHAPRKRIRVAVTFAVSWTL